MEIAVINRETYEAVTTINVDAAYLKDNRYIIIPMIKPDLGYWNSDALNFSCIHHFRLDIERIRISSYEYPNIKYNEFYFLFINGSHANLLREYSKQYEYIDAISLKKYKEGFGDGLKRSLES